MSTTTALHDRTTAPTVARAGTATHARIPLHRIIAVELRKSFDTRAETHTVP